MIEEVVEFGEGIVVQVHERHGASFWAAERHSRGVFMACVGARRLPERAGVASPRGGNTVEHTRKAGGQTRVRAAMTNSGYELQISSSPRGHTAAVALTMAVSTGAFCPSSPSSLDPKPECPCSSPRSPPGTLPVCTSDRKPWPTENTHVHLVLLKKWLDAPVRPPKLVLHTFLFCRACDKETCDTELYLPVRDLVVLVDAPWEHRIASSPLFSFTIPQHTSLSN